MITKDGYAAVPWYGEKYVIIYNGQQIADVDTKDEAIAFIKEEQKKTKTHKKSKSKGRLTLD
jgi:hypothetical protein